MKSHHKMNTLFLLFIISIGVAIYNSAEFMTYVYIVIATIIIFCLTFYLDSRRLTKECLILLHQSYDELNGNIMKVISLYELDNNLSPYQIKNCISDILLYMMIDKAKKKGILGGHWNPDDFPKLSPPLALEANRLSQIITPKVLSALGKN